MRLNLLYTILFLLICNFTAAQTDSCNCTSNFDDLVQKTETNYIAYTQKIKGNNKAEKDYQLFKQAIRKKAQQKNITSCIDVLKKYTDYFKDGHLFVVENPEYSPAELKVFKSGIKEYVISREEAVNYFNKNSKILDPIEGLWYSEDHVYESAIIKSSTDKYQFFAVVLQSTNPQWRPGMVKAIFTKRGHEYAAEYHRGDFGLNKYEASVHKNAVMNIGALMYWGKSFPVSPAQSYIDKNNAGLPTIIKLDAENILVTIPTFLVDGSYMDSLVKAHYSEIISSKNLLIDIRGNGGGNAVYFPLINIYYTRSYKDPRGLALSSPATIRYFEALSSYMRKKPGDSSLSIYEVVVKNMKGNPGKIVSGPDWPKDSNAVILPYPQRVCILTDRYCASAAESFIIHSKGFSNRVTTFGENTHGMIDYTSVNSIPLLCRRQNYYFGYPTSTLHERIPEDGYNATGIAPDVRIDNNVKDKIQFIQEWLKKR